MSANKMLKNIKLYYQSLTFLIEKKTCIYKKISLQIHLFGPQYRLKIKERILYVLSVVCPLHMKYKNNYHATIFLKKDTKL